MDQPYSHEPPIMATTVPTPAPRRRSAGRWILLFVLCAGLLLIGVLIASGGHFVSALEASGEAHVDERYHSLARHGTDKVAIITIEGTILEGDGFVKKQIDHVRDDKHVRAVVLRVNSPGGTVTGSDFLYHHLQKLRTERELPIVVSMGAICASGGYYLSMACGTEENVIFAEPTTWTGSIGVVIPHYDISELAGRVGIDEDAVKSHRLKQMGSMFRKMSDEERGIFQGLVNDSFERFKGIVQSGRPRFQKQPDELDRVATGQVFSTRQALEFGLVDKEGFIEDAIDRAVELAKLDKSTTRAVKYKQPFGLFDSLFMSAEARRTSPWDLTAMLDLATPRAWYLYAWPTFNSAQ